VTADIYLVASGDSRPAANRRCWPAQAALEARVIGAFADLGRAVVRAHEPSEAMGHGFIDSQARGIDVFRRIPLYSPVIVAEAVWQYSSHVLPGLTKHRGPILTLANWSGEWPGLVGLLNLNGSLTKAGIPHSSVWSETFEDPFAREALRAWAAEGRVTRDLTHVRSLVPEMWPADLGRADGRGRALARLMRKNQAILGVFDEGCMGMFNAIVPDHLMHPLGLFKERLSQSALYAAMLEVPDRVARRHFDWLVAEGMTFEFGPDPAQHLTESQVLEGLKMYDAAARMAEAFGCAAIGIQYQQGLKDLCVASDLAEGLLNNPHRPPVDGPDGTHVFDGLAIPHFNEVDECAGIDAVLTNRVWGQLGLDPSTTLHDIRWGAAFQGHGVDEFVWVFEISGAAPASHFIDGYRGACGERQPAMYFPRGGATLKGVSRPGEIVWSRIYVTPGGLQMDIGRGGVVRLPRAETERRWNATTPQWPIMHAVLYGVTRDQFMAKHQANHIQVAYADDRTSAREALAMKAGAASELGIHVNLCGDLEDRLERHQSADWQQQNA